MSDAIEQGISKGIAKGIAQKKKRSRIHRKFFDQHLTKEGVIIIKAQEHCSQKQNREEALQRLQDLIKSADSKVCGGNGSGR
ncbi:hypothetical protein [Aerosakkonema funiforme]|uniref:hypothetical protein n=1 Tax=Aerosakkonema funiforme TaxID=1246630 RepID=UPI0035B75B7D